MLIPLLLAAQLVARQGDVVVAPLSAAECVGSLNIFGHNYLCTPDHHLIIGVDMAQKPGEYPLTETRTLVVRERTYPREPMQQPRPVPAGRSRAREIQEMAYALQLGKSRFAMSHVHGQFSPPLSDMLITNPFGVRRGYGQHRGVDLRAATGTPVHAIGGGVVVLAQLFSVEGNMLIVYHGDGVYALYLHLQKFVVHEGQYVQAGQVVAFSDTTGASKAPHLHFAVKVNGAVVDPLAAIDTFNQVPQ